MEFSCITSSFTPSTIVRIFLSIPLPLRFISCLYLYLTYALATSNACSFINSVSISSWISSTEIVLFLLRYLESRRFVITVAREVSPAPLTSTTALQIAVCIFVFVYWSSRPSLFITIIQLPPNQEICHSSSFTSLCLEKLYISESWMTFQLINSSHKSTIFSKHLCITLFKISIDP